jgi:hypothetical protein
MRIIKKPIIQPRDPDPISAAAQSDPSRPVSNAHIQPPINTKGSSNDDKKWNAARQLRRGTNAAPESQPERSNKRRKLSTDGGYNSDDEYVPRKPLVGLQEGQSYLVRVCDQFSRLGQLLSALCWTSPFIKNSFYFI